MQNIDKNANTCASKLVYVSALADECKQEISMVGKSGAVYEDKASIALLRLATTRNNKQAWFALEYCFRQKLILWLRQHPRSQEALGLQSEQEYVTQAFAHFRHLAVSKHMEFSSLHAALRYLAACLNSVVLDMLRSIKRVRQDVQTQRADLWLSISQTLKEERERRLAYLLFHCGLKPAEVVERCPEEFQNLAEVQSLHVNILNHMIATSLL